MKQHFHFDMTLEILNCFDGRNTTDTTDDGVDDEPLECNYDKDVTYLYQAIEEKAFMAAIDFLESNQEDVVDQCRTWVTRYEPTSEEKIRWSQLPLHAALIFKAPVRVIELLVKQFPKAVRCTDDQKMLPLHLAFRYGASDNVLHLLLKEFPDAMTALDKKERLPLDYSKSGDSWKKGEIIDLFVVNAKTQMDRKVASKAVSQKLDDEVAKTKELTKANATLKNKLKELTAEITALKATPVLREVDSTSAVTPKSIAKPTKSSVKVAKTESTTTTAAPTTATATTTTSRPNSPLKTLKKISRSSKTLSTTDSDRSKRGGFFKTFGKKLKETTKDKGVKTVSKSGTKSKVAQSAPEGTAVKSAATATAPEGTAVVSALESTAGVLVVPDGTADKSATIATAPEGTEVVSSTPEGITVESAPEVKAVVVVSSEVKAVKTAVKNKVVKGTTKVAKTTVEAVPTSSATTIAQQ